MPERDSAVKLSPGKQTILIRLIAVDGKLGAESLSRAERSLASRMQGEGLVLWKATALSRRWTCDGQTLHITDKGRAALVTPSITNNE